MCEGFVFITLSHLQFNQANVDFDILKSDKQDPETVLTELYFIIWFHYINYRSLQSFYTWETKKKKGVLDLIWGFPPSMFYVYCMYIYL